MTNKNSVTFERERRVCFEVRLSFLLSVIKKSETSFWLGDASRNAQQDEIFYNTVIRRGAKGLLFGVRLSFLLSVIKKCELSFGLGDASRNAQQDEIKKNKLNFQYPTPVRGVVEFIF
jgi:hypothetical protein